MESPFSSACLASLTEGRVGRDVPFRHAALEGLLTGKAFDQLRDEYPPLALFERHVGLPRRFGQMPHDRLYLELGRSHYHETTGQAPGVIAMDELSPAWRQFVEHLGAAPYLNAVLRLLGARDATLRFTWHVAFTGCSVSPHRDASEKLGTHLFYFNTAHEWRREWGGATLLFGRRTAWTMNPGFDQFEEATEAPFLGNQSLIFRNERAAWHGVKPLSAPPGAYRKLFAVVFDRPNKRLPRMIDSAEAVIWRVATPLITLGAAAVRRRP
jgi:hypothetical protein